MISRIKKQLLMLALVAGIVAPVSAMDSTEDSSGLFGWKSGAGIAAVVCAGVAYYAYTKWAKPQEKSKPKITTITVAQNQKPTQSDHLKLDTPEDLAKAQQDTDAQIAQLEREIAGGTTNTQPAQPAPVKRPAGPAGRKKPVRKPVATQEPEVMVEEPVVPAQPTVKKPVGGQTHGVQLGDLKKNQLKKTGKAPAKTVPPKK